MMKRIQKMQKEQLISRVTKEFSAVLDKKQLQLVFNTSFKNELGFNDCMIIRDKGSIEIFNSRIEIQNHSPDRI